MEVYEAIQEELSLHSKFRMQLIKLCVFIVTMS